MWHLAKVPLEHQAMVAFNTLWRWAPGQWLPCPPALTVSCRGKATCLWYCPFNWYPLPDPENVDILPAPPHPHTPYCPAPLHSAWHPVHPLRERFWVSSTSRPSSEMPKRQGPGFSPHGCKSVAPGFALWPVSLPLRSPLCPPFYTGLSKPHPPYILSYPELLGSQWLSPWWEAIVCETHRDSRLAKLLPCPACGIIVFSGRADLLARYRSQLCNFYKGNSKDLSGWKIL